ncbi:hypothetical protein ANN_17028 [Periplaneta americana]|uniref:Uncharacterized protein n=1 Tax=Periplaneta americana TaxID=6978 RepID=A0ABQ8SSZ6_PERAM|nr:hypothetical protein ANN_17028 [Periplaneta americana]
MAGLCEGGNESSGSLKVICSVLVITDAITSVAVNDDIFPILTSYRTFFFFSPGYELTEGILRYGMALVRVLMGEKFSHEISAGVWDRVWVCPPSIVMHLGSYDSRTTVLLYKYSTPHCEHNPGYDMDDDDDDDDDDDMSINDGEMSPRSNAVSYPAILLQLVEGKPRKNPN